MRNITYICKCWYKLLGVRALVIDLSVEYNLVVTQSTIEIFVSQTSGDLSSCIINYCRFYTRT